MAYFAQSLHLFFTIYTALILIRIIGSWIPPLARSGVMRVVGVLVDPYLNLFRRLIPPLGGSIDISPILALIGLRLLEALTFYLIFR